MNGGNQSLEEILFALAVQKTDAAERAAFLDQACLGNPALRAALDELLQAHAEAEEILPKRPGGNAPPAAFPRASAPKQAREASELDLPPPETPPAQ